MRFATTIALIGVSLLVSGCLSDQRRVAAKCELMTKSYNVDPKDWRQPSAQKARYMMLCMTAEGYEVYPFLDECQFGDDYSWTSPLCYRPVEAIDRLIYRIEVSTVTVSPVKAWN
jgi:hypothetical protein